ncbi:MAG: hypothetical protein WCI89_02295 [bacterium]
MSGTTTAPTTTPLRKGLRIDIAQPQDSDIIDRDRALRWLVFGTTMILAFLTPPLLLYYWFSHIGPSVAWFGAFVGIVVGATVSVFTSWRLVVSNEEWMAYATLNPFTGKRVLYGPGMHISLPWEERNASGEISLKAISVPFTVAVPTKTSNIISKGLLDYQVDLGNLGSYIGVDESTIQRGFLAYVSSFLTSQISNGTMEEARGRVDEINDALADEFMGVAIPATSVGASSSSVTEFERKFGIRVVSIFISQMELPPEVQRARDGQDEAVRISMICADLMGLTKAQFDAKVFDGSITPTDFADVQRRAMVITGNATAHYDRIDGNASAIVMRPT